MQLPFLFLAAILAPLNWYAADKGLKRWVYLTKPAVMLALIAWLLSNGAYTGALRWFLLGAVFSMLGDVFLMMPPRWFMPGVFAFLLAHVGYIFGFSRAQAPSALLWTLLGPLLVNLGFFPLNHALKELGIRKMGPPIRIYASIISMMTISATLTLAHPEWNKPAAVFSTAGALLFLFSDSSLAYDRFIKRFRHARLVVMSTYHLGQVGILLGAILQFGGG